MSLPVGSQHKSFLRVFDRSDKSFELTTAC